MVAFLLLGIKVITNFLLNGFCQAAKMPTLGSDTTSIEDYRQSLHAKCAKPHRRTDCNCTCSSAAFTRELLSTGGEGCPEKSPHHTAPASPTQHRRGPTAPQAGWEYSSGSVTLKVSARAMSSWTSVGSGAGNPKVLKSVHHQPSQHTPAEWLHLLSRMWNPT